MTFQRENRYIVLKVSDYNQCLTDKEAIELSNIVYKVDAYRRKQGKDILQTVVVERDWPEYEPVWQMIEARVSGAQTAQAVPLLSDAEIRDVRDSFGDEPIGLYALSRAVEAAVRAKMGVAGWIACEDQMPEPGTECLVRVKALSHKQDGPTHYTHIDTWDEQHEAPVSWSSATIPVGLGWGSFDFEDVTHWMPLPPPPGIVGKEGA